MKTWNTERPIALLTRHLKGRVIAPALQPDVGPVVVTEDFDTDRLGNFSRTVARTQSPLECARHKARLAMELTGLPAGMGSEGSFSSGPGGLPWNQELLVLIDHENRLEIVAHHSAPFLYPSGTLSSNDELHAYLKQQPVDQRFILRPDHPDHPEPVKGLADGAELASTFQTCLSASDTGEVFIEYDLRAHCCPERMKRIGLAAENLVSLWQSRCPHCEAPGFQITDSKTGLPCEVCGTATSALYQRVFTCSHFDCEHRAVQVIEGRADPARCPVCNP